MKTSKKKLFSISIKQEKTKSMSRLPTSQTALENERFSYFERPEEEWKK
jgi:hypothetical protein